jgi:hypothetical protein
VQEVIINLDNIKNIDLKENGDDYYLLAPLSCDFYIAVWAAWAEQRMNSQ